MTIEEIIRRKEIEKEAKERFGEWPLNMQFVGGAEWADEHPRKGLVDIEKVIEYLDNKYVIIGRNWAEFREAMEE